MKLEKIFMKNLLRSFSNEKYGDIIEKSFHCTGNKEKYYFDNTNFNKLMALKLGILEENIIISEENTFDDKFHSHRRDGKSAGRAMGVISFINKN